MKELNYQGEVYYYYSDDVTLNFIGLLTVYAQDANGNEFNIMWNKDNTINSVEEIFR